MNETTLDEARAAKEKALATLIKNHPRAGFGITRVGDGYAVKVNLPEPLPPNVKLPETIDGVPIKVEVVGTIRKA